MGKLTEAVDADKGGRRDDIELSYWTVQPNKWTFQNKKMRNWVQSKLSGRVLNACAGKTKLNALGVDEIVRNDIDEQRDADLHVDVCEIADYFEARSFDTIVFDPPFSTYQANTNYDGQTVGKVALAKDQFHELLRPGGRVVQFGFTSTCMPMEDGYQREAVAVFNTLGQMNDILGTVDRKPEQRQEVTLDDDW